MSVSDESGAPKSQSRKAREVAHEIMANVIPVTWKDRDNLEFIYKAILRAFTSTPLPRVGQQWLKTDGNGKMFDVVICDGENWVPITTVNMTILIGRMNQQP